MVLGKKKVYKQAREHPNAHMKHRTLMIFFFIVFIGGVAILLFYNLGGKGVTGKAFEQPIGISSDPNYWDISPYLAGSVVNSACNEGVKVSTPALSWTIDGWTKKVYQKESCCPDTNFCVAAGPGTDTKNYCYSIGSYFRPYASDSLLCVEYNNNNVLLKCDEIYSNGEIYNENYLCVYDSITTYGYWNICKIESFKENNLYYCDGSKWHTCDTKNKGVNVNNKYVCDGTKWQECYNKYCDIKLPTTPLSSIIDIFGKQKQDVNNLTDLKLNNNEIVTNLVVQDPQYLTYFKFNNKNYYIKLDNYNVTEGKAVVEVYEVGGKVIDSVKLETTKDAPYLFTAQQKDLDLDKDQVVDVYANFFGEFTKEKKVFVIVTINSKINLDTFDLGTLLLVSGSTQGFTLKGNHTVSLTTVQDNYFFTIDGVNQNINPKFLSGEYYFDVQKTVGVKYDLLISPIPSLKYVTVNLTKIGGKSIGVYEDYFDLKKSINVGVAGKSEIRLICSDDPPVLSTVSVCKDSPQQLFNLQHKEVKFVDPLLYWYIKPAANQSKLVRTFNVVDLDKVPTAKQEATVFANNLVKGKRVVLKFGDKYYLLSHVIVNYLELPLLMLTDLSDTNNPVYLAEGDQEEVVFNLPLGKQINVKLNLGINLSYTLSGKTSVKNVANLTKELQTKVSTYGAVNIQSPNLNEVVVTTDDITTLKDKMKIKHTFNNQETKIELDFNVPKVVNNSVFYYNKFAVAGANSFNKYADVYLFYNLTDLNSKSHVFNDNEFILPIVKGNKIAFNLENDFYLLGYSEQWDPLSPSGFSFEKLQLTKLGTTEIILAVKKENNIINFDLGKRKINLVIDTDLGLITFQGITAVEVAKKEVDFSKDYAVKLPAGNDDVRNLLELKGSAKGYKFYNCDTPSTKTLKDFFLLCDSVTKEKGSSKDFPFQIDMNVAKEFNEQNEPNFLMRYQTFQNGAKDILLQSVLDLTSFTKKITFNDWNLTTTNLVNGKNPIIKFNSNDYYELIGGKDLSSFKLKKVPTGEVYSIQIHSTKDGYNNGTIVVENNLIFFKQFLDNYNIKLEVNMLNQVLLTNNLVNGTFGFNQDYEFLTQVGGQGYVLKFVDLKNNFIMVKIYEKGKDSPLFSTNLVVGASKQILLSNGDIVQIGLIPPTDPKQKTIATFKKVN